MKAVKDTRDSMIVKRSSCKRNLCLDKGYDFPEIEREAFKRRYVTHILHSGEEEQIKKIRRHTTTTKRWIVERTNSWHNRFRKLLLIRYEKKSTNYLALVQLACCLILYRRIILG
jgi:putative transposase